MGPIIDAAKRSSERVSIKASGLDFTRRVIALALAKANTGNAVEIARERWGPSSAAVRNLETKANKPAGVTSTGWGADFIPTPPDAAEFFGAVEARSIPGRLPKPSSVKSGELAAVPQRTFAVSSFLMLSARVLSCGAISSAM